MRERYDVKVFLQMMCIFSFIAGLHIHARINAPVEVPVQTETAADTGTAEEAAVCRLTFEDEIYLAIGEQYVLPEGVYISQNEEVVSIRNNTITGLQNGSIRIIGDCSSYLVHVSDLYTMPVLSSKEFLPCEAYTAQENEYLDSVLEYEVRQAGYQTRAGVIAAARFLLLRFPYKLNYFFENGRMSNGYGIDGEGRYYHKGLYLSEYKTEEIERSRTGPQIWGCSLYEYGRGRYSKNGMDCSGFVSWVLYNAGFDCGDLGSGPRAGMHDLSDLGEKVYLYHLDIDRVKPGDFVGLLGHIGIVIGMDGENIYIGESYWTGDLHASSFTYEEFLKRSKWSFVVLMDDYYRDQGNLEEMW